MNQENYFTKEIDAWQEVRLGKFTASGIHAILTASRTKGEAFGGTAMTYIKKKVAEIITGEKPEINAKQLEWGIANEQDAVREYVARTGAKNVQYFGIATPKYFELSETAGGSPDGLVGDEGLLEVKCPWDSAVHVQNLLNKTAEDLKKNAADYYTQDQFNMHILNRKWCDHISYDPRVASWQHRLKVIRIDRDEDHIKIILERLELAQDKVREILADLGLAEAKKIIAAPVPEAAEPAKQYKKPASKAPTELPDFLKV